MDRQFQGLCQHTVAIQQRDLRQRELRGGRRLRHILRLENLFDLVGGEIQRRLKSQRMAPDQQPGRGEVVADRVVEHAVDVQNAARQEQL